MMVVACDNDESNVVCYALNMSPKAKDVWERAHNICGGDDFSELIQYEQFENLLNRNCKSVTIKFTPTQFSISAMVTKS